MNQVVEKKMSKRNSSRLNESPDTVSIANSANKRVRTELEVQNTTNAAANKEKFAKVSHVAETEKVAILDDILSNMEKSIQKIQDSINRLESSFKEDLRTIIREEIAGVVKNEIQKEVKNFKIVYEQN